MYALKLSFRNVLKHRRKSVTTAGVVAVGFVSLTLFAGYMADVFQGLREQAVRGEGLGHLTIAKRGYFRAGGIDPASYLLSGQELARISRLVKEDPAAVLATPRLSVMGLISNGRTSTVFVAEGMEPADAQRIRGDFRPDRRGLLDPARPSGAAVAEDLASGLGLKQGDGAVLFTSTAEGTANALDVEVSEVFNTGVAATNDKAVLVPLALAQRLYDTEGAQRVVVLLDDVGHTAVARARLLERLSESGLDVEIKTWEELSAFYVRVKAFLQMIFAFIFSIVVIVVVMSVANTMSMTVVERTREIGTLRSLGLKRWGIVRLFSLEGLLIASLGCVAGVPLALLAAVAVNASNLQYVPPNTSDQVPLRVALDPVAMGLGFALLAVVATLAALVPATKASRRRIVDALGHV